MPSHDRSASAPRRRSVQWDHVPAGYDTPEKAVAADRQVDGQAGVAPNERISGKQVREFLWSGEAASLEIGEREFLNLRVAPPGTACPVSASIEATPLPGCIPGPGVEFVLEFPCHGTTPSSERSTDRRGIADAYRGKVIAQRFAGGAGLWLYFHGMDSIFWTVLLDLGTGERMLDWEREDN